MGQRNSSHQAYGNMSLYRSFRKKKSDPHKDLSATFHVLDVNMMQNNLLNINVASEEELMTLPGITRATARDIVEYRHAIGSFKKVEDLALVSGIGACKLQQIRAEITTNNRLQYLKKNDSYSCQTSLSEEQSLDSFFSGESGRESGRSKPFFKVINVNTANVFQLMSIQGITQEVAANIIHYRDRKGSYKSLDQLLKVKGLNYRILGTIRLYLTTEYSTDIENDSGVLDMKPTGEMELYDQIINNCNKSNKLNKCHRRSKSAPMKYASLKEDTASESEIFILLSNRSKRSILTPYFDFIREKRPAVRIATWNLEKLTDEKASNPGTIEVICRTILENG
ncbi:Endonuclease/exonuclease/phosphatase family domain-containing protein 1 [Nymphon striatum]|nr:Endonuclease/exonuclease/phosphatase family domain-containing protein 1 [Nymphon striatum]